MLEFFKKNFSMISKLFVNQIGIMIFALVVSMATYTLSLKEGAPDLSVAATVFSALFYLVLIYNAVWEDGARDKIRIDGGRMTYMPLKGLYMALFANAVNLLLFVLITAGSIGGAATKGLFDVSRTVAVFLEAMYQEFILLAPLSPVTYLLTVIPGLAVCTVGYIFGAHNFRIAAFFGIKSKEARKVEEQERQAKERENSENGSEE